MQGDEAGMRTAAMFPEVNALPRAQRQPATTDGNGKIDRGKGGADVGGHIVFALGGVDEKRVAVGYEAGEEFLQVPPDVGVGVFLNKQGSGGVAEVEGEEAVLETVSRNPGGDLIGEFVEAAAARGDAE